ncbi:MAG: serine hydrolase domain-containing protein [Candidatus Thorarchaeota archaeon]
MSGSTSRPRTAMLVVALTFFLLTSVSPQSPAIDGTINQSITSQENPSYWPIDGWRYSTPDEQGMDNDTLNAMMDLIEEQEYPIHSVLVIRHGYAVYERYPHEYYPPGHLKLLHSVTKSFASTLIGIAIQQGLLGGVDETVLSFFPEYTIVNPDPRKDAMTIEDLLTMTSGIDWNEWAYPYEYGVGNPLMDMMQSPDAVQYVLDRNMSHTPGEHWDYNGGASLLLGAIVQQVSNMSMNDFAQQYLFDPLGFGFTTWYMTSGGWYNTFGGLRASTRDIAKLGFLYLNNGTWNGTQILPSDFVLNTITPIDIANPLGPDFGYGWHWWMRSDLGIYFAYGRHGQKIMIAPEHDLVVAFTAGVPDDGYDPEFDLFRDFILEALDEVPEPDSLPVLEILTASGIGIVAIAAVVWNRRRHT